LETFTLVSITITNMSKATQVERVSSTPGGVIGAVRAVFLGFVSVPPPRSKNQNNMIMKTQSSNRQSWAALVASLGFLVVAATSAHADYQSIVLADNPLAYYALTPATDPAGDSPDLSGNGNDGYAFQISATNGPSAYIPNAA